MVDGVDSCGPSFRMRNLRKGEAQDENESCRRGDNPETCGVLHVLIDTNSLKFVQNIVAESGTGCGASGSSGRVNSRRNRVDALIPANLDNVECQFSSRRFPQFAPPD